MKKSPENLQPAYEILQHCAPLIEQIHQHPLHHSMHSLDHLRIFMEHHVFAVWDFMCLLKELYRRIVSTHAPWLPPKDAYSARLLGKILLEEEGDLTEDGQDYLSHYELYLMAMRQIGADSQPITHFIQAFANPGAMMLNLWDTPDAVRQFITTTFDFFGVGTPELAAAFVYGREAITECMFTPLLASLQETLPTADQPRLKTLRYYLQRHIELDHDNHFPQALVMLSRLVGTDNKQWQVVANAAERALQARLHFLTGIQKAILEN